MRIYKIYHIDILTLFASILCCVNRWLRLVLLQRHTDSKIRKLPRSIWRILLPNAQFLSWLSTDVKVNFFLQCIKKQLITLQNFNTQTFFSQFLDFSLKFWFKGQIISIIHLSLPNAYKLMCFDRNINGNRNVKFLECD